MIRPERLTLKAPEAFRDAGAEAGRRGNPVANDAHLFLTLLSQEEGVVRPLLQKAGLNVTALTNETERELDRLPRQEGGAEPTFSRELTRAFDKAEKEAKSLGDAYVSTEHLLLGLVERREPRRGNCWARRTSTPPRSGRHSRRSGDRTGSPTSPPKASTRRWNDSPATSPTRRVRENSIR